MKRMNIGIIGCGNISGVYIRNLKDLFHNTEVMAVCDLDAVVARASAEVHRVPLAYADPEELLGNPDIELVVVLTPPASHAALCRMALEAGKHVYCEKPLATEFAAAQANVRLAQEKGLLLGCAPDTILGSGVQTSRKLIEDGWIGTPVGIRCNSIMYGPETWHPNPAFFYRTGAGPVLDLGPYYISAMCSLLGPVKRVQSVARITHPTRRITCPERFGELVEVEVPTYVSGLLEFAQGAVGSITITFDAFSESGLDIEVLGSEGTLIIPNPDTFGGADGGIRYKKLNRVKAEYDTAQWAPVANLYPYSENSRGIGVADMVEAVRSGRGHRANGAFALHVLEVMLALADPASAATEITTAFTPAPGLPLGLEAGEIA